jgi:hypothetical protein
MATTPDHEQSFAEGWELVTKAIRATCGSYGSRLHRGDDDTWVAYALWPDSDTRDRCDHAEEEGERLMADSVAERLPTITMTVVSDLLTAPN